jgi:hypothetical protein
MSVHNCIVYLQVCWERILTSPFIYIIPLQLLTPLLSSASFVKVAQNFIEASARHNWHATHFDILNRTLTSCRPFRRSKSERNSWELALKRFWANFCRSSFQDTGFNKAGVCISGGNMRPTRNPSNTLDIHSPWLLQTPVYESQNWGPLHQWEIWTLPCCISPYFIIFRSERNNQTLKLTSSPPDDRFVQRTASVQKRGVRLSVGRPSCIIFESWKNALQFYAASRNRNFSTVSRTCFLSMLDISWFCSSWDVASIY